MFKKCPKIVAEVLINHPLITFYIIMKNKTKLILANVFALVAVLAILTVFKLQGIEIGSASGSMLPNVLLLAVPQIGFFYFYWMSYQNKKQMA